MPQALCSEGQHLFKLGSVSTTHSKTIRSTDEPCTKDLYPSCNSKHARKDLEQPEDLVQRETKRRRTKVIKTRLAQVKPAHVRRPLLFAPQNPPCTEVAIEDAVRFLMCDELSPPSFSSDHTDGDGDWSSALMDFDSPAMEFEPERCVVHMHHSEPSSPPWNADILDTYHVPTTVSDGTQHCTNPLGVKFEFELSICQFPDLQPVTNCSICHALLLHFYSKFNLVTIAMMHRRGRVTDLMQLMHPA